jgi:uncharacterized RDD family membrane protein YckC
MQTKTQEVADSSIAGIEGVTIQLESAPFLRRAFAFVIDVAIVGGAVYAAIIFVVAFVFGAILSVGAVSETAGAIIGITAGVLGILVILGLFDSYFIYFEYKKGTTLGKRLFGLRVVTLEGNKPSLGQCVARELLRYIDCTLLFPGPIAIALSSKRQRLGDMVAHTRVVYSKRAEAAQQCVYLDHDTFTLYLSESPSQGMSRSFATEFMTYASRRFLFNYKVLGTDLSELQWIERFEQETGQKRPCAASDNESLRFFAECCIRRLAKADRRSDTV